jgi:transcriptional regulator with XRE-family HTH domain
MYWGAIMEKKEELNVSRLVFKPMGRRIRDRRRELGMTIAEAAASLGMPELELHDIETGRFVLTGDLLRRFAGLLDISLLYITAGISGDDLRVKAAELDKYIDLLIIMRTLPESRRKMLENIIKGLM